MHVSFDGYNYDIEASPGYHDNYFGGYVEPTYERILIRGKVKGLVVKDDVTYAIVLSEDKHLHEVELSELRVL